MLRGLTNVSFFADDVEAASRWYADLLGVEPYFVQPPSGPPAYVEFRIGDAPDELGIVDRRFAPGRGSGEPTGAVAYWHVDDLPAALERLLGSGATLHEALTERGAGFVTASVVDPFGNVLGVMRSPHYVEVQASR